MGAGFVIFKEWCCHMCSCRTVLLLLCAAEAANGIPVSWVRVDPQGELLASTTVLQPATMWTAQLDFSRDVVAQSAAVAGLAAERPFTYRALNALHACVENPKVFCRRAAKPNCLQPCQAG